LEAIVFSSLSSRLHYSLHC